jgi:2-oxoglutarate ferredoxin oxidoreductase subunit alpha
MKNKTPNIKVGLLRPITLWPYPSQIIQDIAGKVRAILTVEMSAGQMVEDVKLSVSGRCPVHFYGRTGGGIPSPKDIIRKITEVMFVKEETTCAT